MHWSSSSAVGKDARGNMMIDQLSANIDIVVIGICAVFALIAASVGMWPLNRQRRKE